MHVMRSIDIHKTNIEEMNVDAVIEPDNSYSDFRAKYRIRAAIRNKVPDKPTYRDLDEAYGRAFEFAAENGCRSVGTLPIFQEYFADKPMYWRIAVGACSRFLDAHPETTIDIVFAVTDECMVRMGRRALFCTVAGRYAVMDEAECAIYDLNDEIAGLLTDNFEPANSMYDLWFDITVSPGEEDIKSRINREDLFKTIMYNMDDMEYLCTRSFQDVQAELKRAITRTLDHYDGVLYSLTHQAWERYKQTDCRGQCLVRVRDKTDHWYILCDRFSD